MLDKVVLRTIFLRSVFCLCSLYMMEDLILNKKKGICDLTREGQDVN